MDGPSPRVDTQGMDLFTFARAGDGVLLQEIDDGYDVNSTNEYGDTLVLLAASNGHTGLVRGLVARGADVNRRNQRGLSPVVAAASRGHHDVVSALVRAGADPAAHHAAPSPDVV